MTSAARTETLPAAFHFSEEQEELRAALRGFLAAHCTGDDVRRVMETADGYDPALWRRMAAELGLQGILVPEALGGVGLTSIDVAIVLEELGAVVYPGPFFSTVVLAVTALLESGDQAACEDILPGIAAGATIATLAAGDGRPEVDAARAGDGWRLSGRARLVLDAHLADVLLVVAQAPEGPSLFVVAGDAAGLAGTQQPTMDQTRRLGDLTLEAVPGRLVGAAGDAAAVVERTLQRAALGLAAEQLGGAQRCLDMTVEYAKVRVQFGRPIGSFQAIQHKCADMLLKVETARAAAYYGAWSAAGYDDALHITSSLAKAHCSEAYFACAATAIQVHGGIGYTWEHDAHLHFKRAASSAALLGDPDHHRELLLQRIGV